MRRRLPIVGALVAGFVMWSFLGFLSVLGNGTHVCNILQAVGPGITPRPALTPEQWQELTRARCGDDGVSDAQIVVFGGGYVVMGAVAVRSLRATGA